MDAIVHIGVGKTGTSAIQRTLMNNRGALQARGFYYPKCAARPSGRHDRLGAHAFADDINVDARKLLKITPEGLEQFRSELERDLAEELAAVSAQQDPVVIFSDEGLANMRTEAEVARLKALLAPHFDSIKIVVYMRRQDLHSVSHFSQHIKAGRVGYAILRKLHFYQYDRMLDMWAGVFGEAAIQPRIFERDHMPNGDVVEDFLQVCGLDNPQDFEFAGNLNESLNVTAAVFLSRLNAQMADSANTDWRKGRMRVVNYLLRTFPGKGLRPARADAEEFAARYVQSNERVRAKWFPDQETLFTQAFDSYPERADDESISDEELFAISANVIEQLTKDYSRVRREYADLIKAAGDDEPDDRDF
ncbi:MAG: hypothetical protein NXI12_07370 [Alphaproteobacteria bacterium]|nr:hypothetical protein [Alphaproteobacteria bacterium]